MASVFPTAYFGNVEYFKSLCVHQDCCIETKEHFIKQTIRSRCSILAANGAMVLSVPVNKTQGSKTPIEKVLLAVDNSWKLEHWRSIKSAYASAPFFDYYAYDIESILFNDFDSLIELNTAITKGVISWLNLPVKITFTAEYMADYYDDFRTHAFDSNVAIPKYIQVFPIENSCHSGLSILDLLFCEGPLARKWLL